MEEFVRSLPAAASSPYALTAYAIAALLFLFAGAKLRMAKLLMKRITSIPEGERCRALEIMTGTVLPTHVSPEQWIQHSRLRWKFLLLGSPLIVLLTIATIAILNPTTAALKDIAVDDLKDKPLVTTPAQLQQVINNNITIHNEQNKIEGNTHPQTTPSRVSKSREDTSVPSHKNLGSSPAPRPIESSSRNAKLQSWPSPAD